MMRRRKSWRAAPVTPGRLFPWLLVLAVLLDVLFWQLADIVWGTR